MLCVGHSKAVGLQWGLVSAFRSCCRLCHATTASTLEPSSGGRCGRRAREARRRAVGEARCYLVNSGRDGALQTSVLRGVVTARDAHCRSSATFRSRRALAAPPRAWRHQQ